MTRVGECKSFRGKVSPIILALERPVGDRDFIARFSFADLSSFHYTASMLAEAEF